MFMMGREKEVITTNDIAEFFYQRLLRSGYAPTENELHDIALITFEYLASIGVVIEDDFDF
jgi:hypothetical protein